MKNDDFRHPERWKVVQKFHRKSMALSQMIYAFSIWPELYSARSRKASDVAELI